MPRHARLLISTLAAAAILLPCASASAGVYGGSTDQYDAFVLITKPKTLRPKTFVIGLRLSCNSGASVAVNRSFPIAEFNPVSLLPSGRFSAVRTQTTGAGRLQMTITGRIGHRFASGRLKVTLTGGDTCTSTPLGWTALRSPGRIYAGATSQEEPVVIQRSGKRIEHVDIDWHADCTPSGYVHIPDELNDLPLKATGAFGVYRRATDGTGRWNRAFRGILRRTSGSGTYQVRLARSGNSCSTPLISWNVATG
ncbi:unannotated protein [freshwater metagenome]|uniref:Unannotated protein n=1 Tax=freshwater metagenome TaxID=449393 RepID=A0A6J7CQ42_9ZZZZ|nr:hypothetical protein [Actinomycetota bacterium]